MIHHIVTTTTQITFNYRQGKKPGIEFRHSTRNASKNSAESGKHSVLTLCSLCLPYCEASFRADIYSKTYPDFSIYIEIYHLNVTVQSNLINSPYDARCTIKSNNCDLRGTLFRAGNAYGLQISFRLPCLYC